MLSCHWSIVRLCRTTVLSTALQKLLLFRISPVWVKNSFLFTLWRGGVTIEWPLKAMQGSPKRPPKDSGGCRLTFFFLLWPQGSAVWRWGLDRMYCYGVEMSIWHCIYRKVASSRLVYYSILNSFGQRSQYISIKFPLHKQSENPWMCY